MQVLPCDSKFSSWSLYENKSLQWSTSDSKSKYQGSPNVYEEEKKSSIIQTSVQPRYQHEESGSERIEREMRLLSDGYARLPEADEAVVPPELHELEQEKEEEDDDEEFPLVQPQLVRSNAQPYIMIESNLGTSLVVISQRSVAVANESYEDENVEVEAEADTTGNVQEGLDQSSHSEMKSDSQYLLEYHPSREHCTIEECRVCSVTDCPLRDPMHYNRNGCPVCEHLL